MKLDKITIYRLEMPLDKPFAISLGVLCDKEFVLIKGECDGVVGWGEAAVDGVPFYTSETAETAFAISERVLAPHVKSRDWSSPEEFSGSMNGIRGHSFTKTAFETMLWDIHGKQQGRSVSQLINKSDDSPAKVEVGASIGVKDNPDDLLTAVAAQLERGVERVKIKVKRGSDYEFIRAVRNAFPDVMLMVDANSDYTYEDFPELLKWDEFDLLMIEQPLDHDDLYYHAKLAEKMKTPICLDESVQTPHLADCVIKMKAADIVNIKVGRVGGLTNTVKINDMCEKAGIPVWIGSRMGTSIADSARIAAATLSNAIYPSDACFAKAYMSDDLVKTPLNVVDGRFVEVPTSPGLGVDVDIDKVMKYVVQETSV